MRVLDPGHRYELEHLDGEATQTLQFVKREGLNYPGNAGTCEGVIVQEVLRVLIDRLGYVNQQKPCWETGACLQLARMMLGLLETRASRVHGRAFVRGDLRGIETDAPCETCGHLQCEHRPGWSDVLRCPGEDRSAW